MKLTKGYCRTLTRKTNLPNGTFLPFDSSVTHVALSKRMYVPESHTSISYVAAIT